MGLGDYTNAAICSIGKDYGQGLLRAWVEVQLGLLQINELAWLRHEKSDKDREHLGDAEADIGDVDEVTAIFLGLLWQTCH